MSCSPPRHVALKGPRNTQTTPFPNRCSGKETKINWNGSSEEQKTSWEEMLTGKGSAAGSSTASVAFPPATSGAWRGKQQPKDTTRRAAGSVTGVADRFSKALPPTEKLAVLCAPTTTYGYPPPRLETKQKPRWDVHLPEAGNRAAIFAGVLRRSIAGPPGGAV